MPVLASVGSARALVAGWVCAIAMLQGGHVLGRLGEHREITLRLIKRYPQLDTRAGSGQGREGWALARARPVCGEGALGLEEGPGLRPTP